MRALAWLGIVVLLAAGGTVLAQEPTQPPAKRWVGRIPPPADPLDPWPLESEPLPRPLPVTPTAPVDTSAVASGEAPIVAPLDSSDVVDVVHCRQILVDEPARVPQLMRLLQRGTPLDQALRTAGIPAVDERRRVYVLDDIDPAIATEIGALPDSGWSTPRPWRGRTIIVQVLGREERPRRALPALGKNLDEAEKSRLANLYRSPERSQATAPAADADYKPAAAVEQVAAEYPPAANEAGEVTLVVEVGRVGEVLGVRVESSTNRIFEEPAIAAARNSKFRAAERAGLAEPGTVRLTYKFAAPQQPGSTPAP